MKVFYVTLNNADEAKKISHTLLENKQAVCTNWFPITCAYTQDGEIKSGDEVVLIIKTIDNMREKIEKAVSSQIDYTNFIAEFEPHSVNQAFQTWLDNEVTR